MTKLALFVGSTTAFNVQRLVSNVTSMLADRFTLDLITTKPDAFPSEVDNCVNVHGESYVSTRWGEYRAARTYFETQTPAAAVQLTKPPSHGVLVGLLARRHGVPFVYRYAGDRFVTYRVARGRTRLTAFALNNVVGRLPLSLATAAIVMGPNGKRRLIDRGVDPETIRILPPSIDPGRLESTSASIPGIPENRNVVAFLGRLSHLKGVATLERTLPTMLRIRPDCQFVFVGERKRNLSISSRFHDHVTYVGSVSPSTVPDYLTRADLLVHPSLTEGLPRAVLEALAVGTPVVARDVGDVAYATANTFETDEEFVQLITNFESLPVDDVSSFTLDALRPDYVAFFEDLVAEGSKRGSHK